MERSQLKDAVCRKYRDKIDGTHSHDYHVINVIGVTYKAWSTFAIGAISAVMCTTCKDRASLMLEPELDAPPAQRACELLMMPSQACVSRASIYEQES
jgi:hypothetical protein